MKKLQYSSVLPKVFIEAILISLLVLGHSSYANGAVDVCPDTRDNCVSIYSVDWSNLKAGDVVILHGGTYNQPILISNAVSGVNIISDGASDIFINSYVAFINSRNVGWYGQNRTHIQNTAYPGIAIIQGSSDLVITGTEITNTGLGIWISQAAGCGHNIIGNTIKNSQTNGIAIDKVNCAVGNESIISANTITGNRWHGIELHGNYYIVELNEVAYNGNGIPGTSGIHVYATTSWEGMGQHNIIRFNSSHDNSDINGPDGNGIQLDQYTRFNEVSYNYVFNNNGSGIIVYDSSDAQIFNNAVFNNMIDSHSSHLCCKANIVVYSANYLDSSKSNYVDNVTVSSNTIISDNTNILPIFMDPVSRVKNVKIESNVSNLPQ